ncbi:conserved exported protein of unknown function [Blastococcus saxobsidens DD2]|uniref:Uncharacterized protein n=1 Tax=Blastococcus saxobsidens (strain DD2) TaxID=1146883 RepID=H6RTL3_BLASD|nr:conserved exported protein of unknown function [Blastococcus saxobsidens DD2]
MAGRRSPGRRCVPGALPMGVPCTPTAQVASVMARAEEVLAGVEPPDLRRHGVTRP